MAKFEITKSPDLTNAFQKLIAGAMAVGVGAVLYFALPPLVTILKNLWITLILGGSLAFVAYNYDTVWNLFKQMSWEMTKKVISSNKLWHMWQGYHYLVKKNAALNENIVQVGAIKASTQKRLVEITKEAEHAKKEAVFEENKGAPEVKLKVIRNKVALYENQFNILEPRLKYIENQHKQLAELHGNWVADTIILQQTLEAKEEEYKIMKRLSAASDSASAFLKDTPEMRSFKESLKQIEESINQYTSNVENFQRNILPTIAHMDTQREMNEEEGKKLIEEYKLARLQFKNA